jgi:hypothetical protein
VQVRDPSCDDDEVVRDDRSDDPMSCCERCAAVERWTYELCGDGDGIEFLVEVAQLADGRETTSTVVYRHVG